MVVPYASRASACVFRDAFHFRLDNVYRYCSTLRARVPIAQLRELKGNCRNLMNLRNHLIIPPFFMLEAPTYIDQAAFLQNTVLVRVILHFSPLGQQ